MIEIIKVYKDNCPLCKSVTRRLKSMAEKYSNLRVMEFKWDDMNDEQRDWYISQGVKKVPFIIVLDEVRPETTYVQKKVLIIGGFTPKRLIEQIEEISGRKLVEVD